MEYGSQTVLIGWYTVLCCMCFVVKLFRTVPMPSLCDVDEDDDISTKLEKDPSAVYARESINFYCKICILSSVSVMLRVVCRHS